MTEPATIPASLPMPGSIEELQALLDREDNRLTIARAIELPRVPSDDSLRCGLLIAGPEAVELMNILVAYLDAVLEASKRKMDAATLN
jgi:hypothetical protein